MGWSSEETAAAAAPQQQQQRLRLLPVLYLHTQTLPSHPRAPPPPNSTTNLLGLQVLGCAIEAWHHQFICRCCDVARLNRVLPRWSNTLILARSIYDMPPGIFMTDAESCRDLTNLAELRAVMRMRADARAENCTLLFAFISNCRNLKKVVIGPPVGDGPPYARAVTEMRAEVERAQRARADRGWPRVRVMCFTCASRGGEPEEPEEW